MSKASKKTYAHALRLAQSDRRLSTHKPDHYLDILVSAKGARPSFKLTCGSEVSTCEVPEGGSVRDIADQLVGILAEKSGASAQQMSMGDIEGGTRTKAVLVAVKAPKPAK